MKRHFARLIPFVPGLLLPAFSLAQDISISDIRIPSSQSQKLILSAFYSKYNRQGSYTEAYQFPPNRTYDETSGNFNSQGNVAFDLAQYDEDNTNEMFINLAARKYGNNSERADTSFFDARSYRLDEFTFRPYWNKEIYLSPDALFLRGVINGNARYFIEQSPWNYRNGTSTATQDYWRKERSYDVSLGAGAGYGKIRDGAHVFAAVRVLQQLEQDSALARSLTTDEILRIADIFARRGEYFRMFERSHKYIIRDIVAELRKMNALRPRKFDAYNAVRLSELVFESIQYRLTGWKVSGLFQYRLFESRREGKDYSNNLWNTFDRGSRPIVYVQGEYGLPLSLSMHVYSRAFVELQISGGMKNVNLEWFGRVSYEATDRMELYAEASVRHDHGTGASQFSETHVQRYSEEKVTVGGLLFIEDRVYLTGSLSYQWDRNNSFDENSYPSFPNQYKSYWVNLGLNFRLF